MNWLRRMDELKNVPIVIITGAEPEKYKERALVAGAIDFFHKPFENEELLAVVRRTLVDNGLMDRARWEDFLRERSLAG